MRWALLFLILASVFAWVNVVRGVTVHDGVSLLAVACLALSALAGFLTWLRSREEERR